MNQIVKGAILGVIVSCCAAVNDAAAGDQPGTAPLSTDYQRIVVINPFGLTRTNPSLAAPPKTASTNLPPNLRLSGITSSVSNRLAYFVQGEGGRNPRCFSLAEGQKEEGVELLAIDPQVETVTIRFSGIEFKLLLKAGVPSANVAAPALRLRGSAADPLAK